MMRFLRRVRGWLRTRRRARLDPIDPYNRVSQPLTEEEAAEMRKDTWTPPERWIDPRERPRW
jgi:hypothetical protein